MAELNPLGGGLEAGATAAAPLTWEALHLRRPSYPRRRLPSVTPLRIGCSSLLLCFNGGIT